jgi:hypothetical protein
MQLSVRRSPQIESELFILLGSGQVVVMVTGGAPDHWMARLMASLHPSLHPPWFSMRCGAATPRCSPGRKTGSIC